MAKITIKDSEISSSANIHFSGTISGVSASFNTLTNVTTINAVNVSGTTGQFGQLTGSQLLATDYFKGELVSSESRRITSPNNAYYRTGTSSVTGAIKITLPVSWTNTMMTMKVKIYEYVSGKSFEVFIGGYNYVGAAWYNATAYVISQPGIDRDFSVRFGYDSSISKCVIYIGELDTIWSFPQVFVTDVQLGFDQASSISGWDQDWSVSFENSAFQSVNITVSSVQISKYQIITSETSSAAAHYIPFITGDSTGKYQLKTSSGIAIIPSTGNVGIGTTTSNATLAIARGSGNDGTLRVLGTSYSSHFNFSTSEDTYIRGGKAGSKLFLNDISGHGDVLIHSSNPNGKVGIGTTSPTWQLDAYTGRARFDGLKYDETQTNDNYIYFAAQKYIEEGISNASNAFKGFTQGDWNIAEIDNAITSSNSVPFSKVVYNDVYSAFYSDFIPVQPGETLYGEIWVMRETGATGSAGPFYLGVERYDKDKRAIAGNNATVYFIASNVTIPTNSTWTKYSGTITLPTSHTPYNGSDGGPVRYVKIRHLVNYVSGTIRTYWGGLILRRQNLIRDTGNISLGGSNLFVDNINNRVGIGTISPNTALEVVAGTSNSSNIADGIIQIAGANDVLAFTGQSNLNPTLNRWGFRLRETADGDFSIRDYRNSVTRILINSAGNVGIGTTSPSYKLDVAGDLRVTGSAYITGSLNFSGSPTSIIDLGSTGYIRNFGAGSTSLQNTGLSLNSSGGATIRNVASQASGYLRIETANGQALQLQPTAGNVGIGTQTPDYTLSVTGTLGVSGNTVLSTLTASNIQVDTITAREFYTQLVTSSVIYESGSTKFGDTQDDLHQFTGSIDITGSARTSNLIISQDPGSTTQPQIQFIGSASNPITLKVLDDNSLSFVNNSGNEIFHLDADLTGTIFSVTDGSGIPSIEVEDTGDITLAEFGGNVGVGTSSPSYKLDVSGTLRVTGTSQFASVSGTLGQFNSLTIVNGSTSLAAVSGTIGEFTVVTASVFTGSTGLLTALTASNAYVSGNLGIGTATPAYKLDVNGTSRFSDSIVANGNLYVNEHLYLNTNKYLRSIDSFRIDIDTDNNQTDRIFVVSANSAATELFRVQENGNVGIGTSSPTAPLHIVKTGGATGSINVGLIVDYEASAAEQAGAGTAILFRGKSGGGNIPNYDQAQISTHNYGTNNAHGLSFYTKLNGSTELEEKVRINANGLVGIGTTSPTQLLEVYGSSPFIRINNADETESGIEFVDAQGATTQYAKITYNSSANELDFYANNATPRMTIAAAGDVGIGTTSPSTKLEVRGGAITAGTNAAPSGTEILRGYYTNGSINVIGSEYSSGGTVIGYGVKPSTSSAGAFLSSTGIALVRSAYTSRGYHVWYVGANQTVAENSAVTLTEVMKLDSSGFLGIGTSSPSAKLHVEGNTVLRNSGADTIVSIAAPQNYNHYIAFSETLVASRGVLGFAAGSGDLVYRSGASNLSNGTERLRITSGGNVGIGITNPDASLTIARLAGAGGALKVFGTTHASHFSYSTPEDTYIRGGKASSKVFINDISGLGDVLIHSGNPNGKVGIGTTTPGAKLDVSGSTIFGKLLTDTHQFTGSIDITGSARTSNLIISPEADSTVQPKIQFIGSSSNPIDLKVLDDNTLSFEGSAGQLFSISNNLTGGVIFSVSDVSGIPLLEADASGTVSMARFGTQVGIGTNTTTDTLTISGGVDITGSLDIVGSVVGDTAKFESGNGIYGMSTAITMELGDSGATNAGALKIWGNSSGYALLQATTTNLHIDTFGGSTYINYYDGTFLQVGGTDIRIPNGSQAAPSYTFYNDTNTGMFLGTTDELAFSTAGSERLRIDNSGNVGIGTTNPTSKLDVVPSNTYDGITIRGNVVPRVVFNSSQASSLFWGIGTHDNNANNFSISKNTTGHDSMDDLLVITNTGNVGIGTITPSAKLDVNGNTIITGSVDISGTLSATAKSFDIPHPTKDGMRLRYGSLEGPENGVYIRGIITSSVIDLPEYWTGLVDEDTITVNLTPVGGPQQVWVEEVRDNKVILGGDITKCYYMVLGERKDIDKLVVEY